MLTAGIGLITFGQHQLEGLHMTKLVRASLLAIFALACSQFALAQNITNEARIMSNTAAFASVSGAGSSLSDVKTSTGATANGMIALSPATAELKGDIAGYSSIIAFNVRDGAGVGSAGGRVWSDARVHGDLPLAIPTGAGYISLDTEGGFRNPGLNGSDVTVLAGSGQDGLAAAIYNAGGAIKLTMSSGPSNPGVGVQGNLTGTTYEHAESVVAGVVFIGGTPAGQSAAVRFGQSGVESAINGWLHDPVAGF